MFKLRPFNRWQCFLRNWWYGSDGVANYGLFEEPREPNLEGINLWNYHRFDPEHRNFTLFVFSWSFEGIPNMAKDAVNTFRPYRAPRQFIRDLGQPIYAIGHLLVAGWFTLMLVAVLIGYGTLIMPCSHLWTKKHPGRMVINDLLGILEAFFIAITQLLRAITQIIATPLTWLLKIPFRLILTGIDYLIHGHFQRFEDRESIQILIADGNRFLASEQIKKLSPLVFEEKKKEIIEKPSNGKDEYSCEVIGDPKEIDTILHDKASMTYIAYRLHQKFLSAQDSGQDLGQYENRQNEERKLWAEFRETCWAQGPMTKVNKLNGTHPQAFARYLQFFAPESISDKAIAQLPNEGYRFIAAPSA